MTVGVHVGTIMVLGLFGIEIAWMAARKQEVAAKASSVDVRSHEPSDIGTGRLVRSGPHMAWLSQA